MAAEFRSKNFQSDEPSTWIPAFIQYIDHVRKYEDLVAQIQEAQGKVAGLQVEHVEPSTESFLADAHREVLRYRVSKEMKSDVQLEDPFFPQTALWHIKVALQETFVREAIGEKVESCYTAFKTLLDPIGKEILVRDRDSGVACEQKVSQKTLHQEAYDHLIEAKHNMEAFKNENTDLDKILKQVKKVAPITQRQNPDEDEIIFERFEPAAPESSRAERTKFKGPLELHYMG